MLCCKIFENYTFAKNFMDGKIYFSRAGRFSKAKDVQRKYFEGMTYIFDKPIFIGGERFDVPYQTGYIEIDRIPMFCCTAIDACNIKVIDGRYTFDIPEENKAMGMHLVVFDIDEFYRLISSKLTELGYGIIGRKMKYYDFEKLKDNSWLTEINNQYDCLFIHDSIHQNQNEFRFVLKHKLLEIGEDATTFDVGEWKIKPRYIELKEKE